MTLRGPAHRSICLSGRVRPPELDVRKQEECGRDQQQSDLVAPQIPRSGVRDALLRQKLLASYATQVYSNRNIFKLYALAENNRRGQLKAVFTRLYTARCLTSAHHADFVVTRVNLTTYGQQSPAYAASCTWNSHHLNSSLKLKTHLFHKSFPP